MLHGGFYLGISVMTDAWTAAYKAAGYQNKIISRYIPRINGQLVTWVLRRFGSPNLMILRYRTFENQHGWSFYLTGWWVGATRLKRAKSMG